MNWVLKNELEFVKVFKPEGKENRVKYAQTLKAPIQK